MTDRLTLLLSKDVWEIDGNKPCFSKGLFNLVSRKRTNPEFQGH